MRKQAEPDRWKRPARGRDVPGPAPPVRKKKTAYYQKMSRNTEDAPATQPEAFSSSSRYESPEIGRQEAQQDERRPFGPERPSPADTGRTTPENLRPGVEAPEEPGRLRFTPSDELKREAGDPSPAGKPRGRQQARRYADKGKPPEGSEQDRRFTDDRPPEGKKSRLHFTKEERPPEPDATEAGPEPSNNSGGDATGEAPTGNRRQEKKTDKAKSRFDRATSKAQQARDNLPTQRRVRLKKEFDEDAGRPRRRLRFETEVKPEGKRNLLARGALTAGRAVDLKAHQKIHQVEQENVGVEAAHKTELTAENLASTTVRFAYRHHKHAPYHKLRKWEKKAAKANVNYLYQRTLQENPELKKSLFSRMQQKRQIKKNYAKAAREAKRGAEAAKETAGLVGNAVRAVASFVGGHKKLVAIGALIAFIVFFFASCTSSCSSMLAGGFASILGTSYGSEDTDIHGAEDDYTQLEKELQERIDNIESDYPGYDEYRYELDEIGHNPFELTSYLTAKLQEYTRASARAELQALFDEQYILTLTESVEIRTYTDEDGDEHEYEWYILTVTLTNKTLPAVADALLTDDQKTIYTATLITKGNKPYLWDGIYTGGGAVDPGIDYEIPGEALSDPDFAALIGEAEKYLGYPYVWGGSSPSTSFDCSGFVCWVYTHSGVYNLPRTTATGIYNQCAIITPDEARPGDCIFFTRTYDSAGPVSHIGIYVGNGMMIHAGDPIKYANINTPYWQEHFYAFGRLPY